MQNTKTFEVDNTVYFECAKDTNGVLTDPTDPSWEITTKKGVVEDNTAGSGGPYKRSTGLWYVYWTSDTVGDYILTYTGKVNGYNTIVRKPFRIKKTNAIY